MSQRERYLAIAVAVVIGLFGAQYIFSKVSKTITDKQDAVDQAMSDSSDMDKTVTSGMLASRRIDELKGMSLPSDKETAIAQYRDWLADLGNEVDMDDITVSQPENPAKTTAAYNSYNFTLRGLCRTDRVLDLLARFYDKNYLHSIRGFKMLLTNEANVINITLDAQALSLRSAAPDQEHSDTPSGRLAMSVDEYKDEILNRNPWAPPNNAPTVSNKSADFVVGNREEFELDASDSEGHKISFRMLTETPPEGMRLRGNTIYWTPQETGKYEVDIEATDNGWPNAVSKPIRLVFNVNEPRKEEPKVEPPKFDVASQAFVTGLTGGRDGRKLWIRSRTDGQSLTLGEGAEFELGNIKAKVLSINLKEDFALLESEGMRWTVDMDTSLADAYQRGQID